MSTNLSIHEILEKYVPEKERKHIEHVLYGIRYDESNCIQYIGSDHKATYDVEKYKFSASIERNLNPRRVNIAAIQHSIVLPTTAPLKCQREAIFEKVAEMIGQCAAVDANIICLPETWNIPFAFCTREKERWCELAEDAESGCSTQLLRELAKRYGVVIISPIFERDHGHGDTLWNTAVVISEKGEILGKQRKNHIPSGNGESVFYSHGTTGHPVFNTSFGRIGVSICFDRHHPLNWMMFALNGAEIVFNPCATTVNEVWWPIEARSAAFAHSFYTVAINRVGTETYQLLSGGTKILGPCYGSTYIAAPDGSCTKGLSRVRDGVLFATVDLSLCHQMKKKLGLAESQRLHYYKDKFAQAADANAAPQIIRSPNFAQD